MNIQADDLLPYENNSPLPKIVTERASDIIPGTQVQTRSDE